MFEDDGSIPNNPRLPVLIYRNAIDISGTPDRESVIEAVFAEHGWGEMWRNGIHPYVHYHSSIHEALGIAAAARGPLRRRAWPRDRAGPRRGRLPAGTGHQCLWAGPDGHGAYPPDGRYDLCRGSKGEHAKALTLFPGAGPEGRPDLRRQRTAAPSGARKAQAPAIITDLPQMSVWTRRSAGSCARASRFALLGSASITMYPPSQRLEMRTEIAIGRPERAKPRELDRRLLR
jgi:uncharacterized protein YjlB